MKVNNDRCISCGACVGACPVEAISFGDDGKAQIDTDKCINCGTCVGACAVGAIEE